MPAPREEVIEAAGREVKISNPDKLFFPKSGHTKLDLVRYYMAVSEGALRGVYGRPMALKRFVNGAEGEAFFQKRAPTSRPEWIEPVELSFPSGRGCPRSRSRTACPRHRHEPLVEGRAARRLPRLQPEREGPHGRVRLFRPADRRCPGLHSADVGRSCDLSSRGLHDRHCSEAIR